LNIIINKLLIIINKAEHERLLTVWQWKNCKIGQYLIKLQL